MSNLVVAFVLGVVFGAGMILFKLAFWIGMMKHWIKGSDSFLKKRV